MKLLFDENLSDRLVARLSDLSGELLHVKNAGLGRTPDIEIWSFARDHGYTLVTQDSDFSDLARLEGPPPKVVLVRTGNTATRTMERILRERWAEIVEFAANEDALLVVTPL